MMNSLLIIGPDINQRGVGGVTIHVQRLKDFLSIKGYAYDFYDSRSNGLIKLFKAIARHRIIHVHISNPQLQLVLVLFGRLMGKRVVMTLHGDYGRFVRLKNHLTRLAITTSSIPIVLNAKSYDICKRFNENTRLIPSFIPPQKEELLQKEVLDMLEHFRKERKFIVSTNASNTSVDKEGKDIYGIDFLVDYYKEATNAVLVISDPSGNYRRRYGGSMSNSVFFIDYPHSFFQVLKHVDCFVRNTSTDGDALSVKEALYLGVPVLCTDVVDRPEGVRLFKYCDRESFESGMKCLARRSVTLENGAEMVLSIYNSFFIN